VQKIVIEIVIEIGLEQTRLFQCDRFHYAIFVIEIVIDFSKRALPKPNSIILSRSQTCLAHC